jgi:hypothetical protein
MTLEFNITFDDGDTWRVRDSINATAWRPDPEDISTGTPLLMAPTLGMVVALMREIRDTEKKAKNV